MMDVNVPKFVMDALQPLTNGGEVGCGQGLSCGIAQHHFVRTGLHHLVGADGACVFDGVAKRFGMDARATSQGHHVVTAAQDGCKGVNRWFRLGIGEHTDQIADLVTNQGQAAGKEAGQ